ncbi:MAG: DNA polymerase III subunit gamma/tau [Bacteroidetes bacterium]|jgi:DNA polymerase-3 subunit gamma/tau|nr:DNA polymerase III subunit gamma/tau [Bacteroidota bacterium]
MSDQHYLVAARKYRPNRFDELVAQEHVTSTLKNALQLDRLAHAYLFSGPRGVGKTTAARILAKAINCATPLDEREDAEPCRTCDSCRSFEAGRSLNVFELDAASNNGVDDIRDLREKVRIPPQGNRKKVYILDEVHMLSKAAFNALLKTLEEPPPHALFIFATTEPHKVLPTILSRCQRFDFRRIPVPEIVSHLSYICEEEGITADEASLMLLARKGDGALRDALSAFDQAVSLCGTTLVYEELADALGVVGIDNYFQVTERMAARDSAGMLQLVNRLVSAGYDLQEFLSGLAEHLRNLTVACTMDDATLIEASSAIQERYAEAAAAFQEATLLRALMIVDDTEDKIRDSRQPRLKLELALLKMAALGHAADLRDTLHQLTRLEKLAREGKLPATLPGTGGSSPETPSATPAAGAPSPEAESPKPKPNSEKSTDENSEGERSEGAPTSHAQPAVNEAREDYAPTPAPSEAPASPPSDTSDEAPGKAPAAAPTPGEPPEHDTDASSAQEERDEAHPPAPQEEQSSDAPSAPAASPSASDSKNASSPAPSPSSFDDDLGGLFSAPALQNKRSSREADANDGGDGTPQNQLAGAALSGDGDVATLEAPPTATEVTTEVTQLKRIWPQLVQAIKRDNIGLGSALQQAVPLKTMQDTAVIGVSRAFYKQTLQAKADLLLSELQDMVDRPIERLEFRVKTDMAPDATYDDEATFDVQAYLKQEAETDPVMRSIFEQFGGEVVW